VVGTAELLRTVERALVAAAGGIVAAAILSVFALAQWDSSFNGPYRDRLAIAGSISAGPFLAIDAAAWRWIADRSVIVIPVSIDPCSYRFDEFDQVRSLVLEPAHFSQYDALISGELQPQFIGAPQRVGNAQIFPVDAARARSLCLNIR